MGWLTPDEQQAMRRRFRVDIHYVCDYCQKPILGVCVIDPKGGYYPWPQKTMSNVKPLTGREPKITYHPTPCNEYIVGKRVPSRPSMAIYCLLLQKPKKRWTRRKLVRKFAKLFDKAKVLKGIRILRKKKLILKKEGRYVPAKG